MILSFLAVSRKTVIDLILIYIMHTANMPSYYNSGPQCEYQVCAIDLMWCVPGFNLGALNWSQQVSSFTRWIDFRFLHFLFNLLFESVFVWCNYWRIRRKTCITNEIVSIGRGRKYWMERCTYTAAAEDLNFSWTVSIPGKFIQCNFLKKWSCTNRWGVLGHISALFDFVAYVLVEIVDSGNSRKVRELSLFKSMTSKIVITYN